MGSRHNNYLQLKLAGLVHNQTYCLKQEIKQSYEKQWKKQKSKYKYNDDAWLPSQYASYTTYISVYQWKFATITQFRQITERGIQ